MAHDHQKNNVKVIEQSEVPPPPGSVPTTSVPLTYFDVLWLFNSPQPQFLYFYEFPHSAHTFLETQLPALKHSLSLALQHFFPFAANLVCPPPPAKPHILFTDGDSSVSLTIAECTADFSFLSSNRSRPIQELRQLVPKLAPARLEGNTRARPLLALQVTVFPNSGICIGVRFSHVAADGRSLHHFMESWALICKSSAREGDLRQLSSINLRLPSYDRAAIMDPRGLELVLLKMWWSSTSTWSDEDTDPTRNSLITTDNVRATFVLGKAHIDWLKRWVTNHELHKGGNSMVSYISSFVVTYAFIWVCLVKSEETKERVNEDDEPYYFGFVADCRSRLEFPLPSTYFGNCLTPCYAPLKRKELLEENGLIAAAKAIGKEVGRLESVGPEEFEKWPVKYKESRERGEPVTVTGSTKFGVYEVDFGWGRPKKCEWVHVEDSSTIGLAESRDDRGGVEVGLVLSKDRMNRFSDIFKASWMKLGFEL